MVTLSNKGEKLLKDLEGGLRLKPYPDAKGYSIGYGHYIKKGEDHLMDGITKKQADELFSNDVKEVVDSLNKAIKVPLNPDQQDALVVLGYNIGWPNIPGLKLIKLINNKAPMSDIVKRWVEHWITSDDKPSQVLVKRRNIESALFSGAWKPGAGTFVTLAALVALLYSMEN